MATPRKKTAETAARNLLEQKVALVGELANAKEEVDKADNDIDAAKDRKKQALEGVRIAYDHARNGGWTTAELADLGYERPRAARTSKSEARGAHSAQS